jgi:hypothetical protein
MFTPDEIDYSRLDVSVLLETHGIGAVDSLRLKPCERWLIEHGYVVTVVDFGQSFPDVLSELATLLEWERQFGYRVDERLANLNTFADGFEFPISGNGGHVLCVLRPEVLAASEPGWFDGFLDIASSHSLFHLACGSRFLTLLVIERDSKLPGRTFASHKVPGAYRSFNARKHGFLE